VTAPDVMAALQKVRDTLNRCCLEPEVPFTELDLIEAAALAPRSVPEAEARMSAAEEESEVAYRFLSDWTKWADELVPHPRKLTRWDSTRLRERIAGVVMAARDWSPYSQTPPWAVALAGMPAATTSALVRAVNALQEDWP